MKIYISFLNQLYKAIFSYLTLDLTHFNCIVVYSYTLINLNALERFKMIIIYFISYFYVIFRHSTCFAPVWCKELTFSTLHTFHLTLVYPL